MAAQGTASADAVTALKGVPETMLWPLWNRAAETKRRDALLEDRWAVSLVDELATVYDFEASFGKPRPTFHGIRARVCDDLVKAHAKKHGERAMVVALGEGVDTSRLRTGFPAESWTSVDLPESIAAREAHVPGSSEERLIAKSALDFTWIDDLAYDATRDAPPLITACGLLMYFEEEQVVSLLREISTRLPGAEIFFDSIPPRFSKRSLTPKGVVVTPTYSLPPMPFGVRVVDLPDFLKRNGWTPVKVQDYSAPFPSRLRFYWWLGTLVPPVRAALAGSLAHARC